MADKYYRLVSFVLNICPQPLRQLFLKYMNEDTMRPKACTTLSAYLVFQQPQMQKSRKIKQDQWDLLYPSSGQADESTWDITLIIILLEECFKSKLEPDEVKAIQDIRNTRNFLQHMAETSIDDADFNEMWKVLESATVDLAKRIKSLPAYAGTIKDYIDDAKINNMPKLGDTLRHWYDSSILQLKSELEDVNDTLIVISNNASNCYTNASECRDILVQACVSKVGPSGEKVKRMKTVDQILANMNHVFLSTLRSDLPSDFDHPVEVYDIKSKLRDTHHVVVAGYRGSRYLETALAAIKDMGYNNNRCVEMRDSSDWRHVDPDDVDLVLCKEPFGDYTYDENKVKSIADIFNSILRTVRPSHGSNHLDIVFVCELEMFNQITQIHKHDILQEVVQVYQPTSETEPADLTMSTNTDLVRLTQSPAQNMLDFTRVFVERTKDEALLQREIVENAKSKLKLHKAIVITGPRKCGKTTLAISLASVYDPTQFMILNKPDDMKLVQLNSICLVLVEDFAGKYLYDEVKACAWLEEFEMLQSVVSAGKLNVIITCEENFLSKCQDKFGMLPILGNTVKLEITDIIVKQEQTGDNRSEIDVDMATSSSNPINQYSEKNLQKFTRMEHTSDAFNDIKGMCSISDKGFLYLHTSGTVSILDVDVDDGGIFDIAEQNVEMICSLNEDELLIVSDKQLSVYQFPQNKQLKTVIIGHECDCISAGNGGQVSILDDTTLYIYDKELKLAESKSLPIKSRKETGILVTGSVIVCDKMCVFILKETCLQSVSYKQWSLVKRSLYFDQKKLQPIILCAGDGCIFLMCSYKNITTKVLRYSLDLEKLGELALDSVFYTPYNVTGMLYDKYGSRFLVAYSGKVDELSFDDDTGSRFLRGTSSQITSFTSWKMTESEEIVMNAIPEYKDSGRGLGFCQHPDGSFLCLIQIIDTYAERKLHLMHYSSELEYIRHFDIDFPTVHIDCEFEMCCTYTGDVLIGCERDLKLYIISYGTCQCIESTELSDTIGEFCTYKNKVYVTCVNSLVYVIDAKLEVKKTFKTCEIFEDKGLSVLMCSTQKMFYIDNFGNIFLDDPKQRQIRYKVTEGFTPQQLCAASEDSVFVLGKQDDKNSRILQMNIEMEIIADILLEGGHFCECCTKKVVFDRANARFVLHKFDDPDKCVDLLLILIYLK